jgi:hypothetical protein
MFLTTGFPSALTFLTLTVILVCHFGGAQIRTPLNFTFLHNYPFSGRGRVVDVDSTAAAVGELKSHGRLTAAPFPFYHLTL